MKIEENEKKAYIKELGSRKGKNQDREDNANREEDEEKEEVEKAKEK